jgi:acetyl esterase/lipase
MRPPKSPALPASFTPSANAYRPDNDEISRTVPFANKLRDAGVPVTTVRHQGTIHDFVMLNALAGTHAARSAVALAVATLRQALSQ